MKKLSGIYAIHNLKTGKKYIGKSVNIFGRFRDHRRHLNNNTHHSAYLQRSWNKHGEKNFIYGIIEECEKEFLSEREVYWINYYDSYNNGYNCDLPSKNQKLRNYTEKDKYNLSQQMKEYHSNPKYDKKRKEAYKKMIETTKKRVLAGEIVYPKHSLSLYDKNFENKLYFESYKECAKFLKVTIKKLYKAINKLKDVENHVKSYKGYYILTEEDTVEKYKNRILIKNLNYKIFKSKGVKQDTTFQGNSTPKNAVPLVALDLNNTVIGKYNSAAEASRYLNVRVKPITAALRGDLATYKSMVFIKQSEYSPDKDYTIKRHDKNKLNKKVHQYDMNGTYITSYNSILEAKNATRANNISGVISGTYSSSKGFIWSLEKVDKI